MPVPRPYPSYRFCGYNPGQAKPVPVEPAPYKGILETMASELTDSFKYVVEAFDQSVLGPKTRSLESLELADVVKAVHKAFISYVSFIISEFYYYYY